MVSKRRSRNSSFIPSKRVVDTAMSTLPKINSLFYNRNYLYFISLFSIIYFIGHTINHEYVSLIIFMITAIFTYVSYSKNMSIVLTMSCIAAILLTSLYISIPATNTKEGMTTTPTKDTKNIKNIKNTKASQPPKKNTEKLTPLQPASFQKNKRGPGDFDVDLASTLEQSYGMLNNLLDNDGISNLTDETKRLIGEQKKLFQSMNSMAPLIGQAKEMLGMFNTNDFKQMEGLAQSTMKNLGEKKGVTSGEPTIVEGLQRKVNFG